MLQILIKVTDLIQGLAAEMRTKSLTPTALRGHRHLRTGLGATPTGDWQEQAGLFYRYYCSVFEDALYSILNTCHLYEGFHKIRSPWNKA